MRENNHVITLDMCNGAPKVHKESKPEFKGDVEILRDKTPGCYTTYIVRG